MSIGDNIRKYRKAAGLKQWQLGEMVNVSMATIHHYEVGDCLPPVTLLKPLAKALNVSVEALLEGEDENEN